MSHRRTRKRGTRRWPQKAADTLSSVRLSESEFLDEQGEPLPELIRVLIAKVLAAPPLGHAGRELNEELAKLNDELEHLIRVCEVGCAPIHVDSVFLKLSEVLKRLDELLS
jgi:hypothetical protein